MKPRTYEILSRAIEQGLAHAWRTAFKHDPFPPVATDKQWEQWEEAAHMEIMSAINEVFNFEDER